MRESVTYEQELRRSGVLFYTTKGTSMRPFIRSQEDMVVIEAKKDARFKKYDVVLFRRDDGQHVLHRIVKVYEDAYRTCGDNSWRPERRVTDEQILGVLTGIIRDGKQMDISSPRYRTCVRIWCALYPVRATYLYLRGKIWAVWKKIKAEI